MSTQTAQDPTETQILHLLNMHQIENPRSSGLDRAIIQATLRLTQGQLELHMLDLAKKAHVTLKGGAGNKWVFAEITLEGIKELNGGNTPSSAVELSPELLLADMGGVFKLARYQVRETGLSSGDKGKIEKHLKELESELQKGKKSDLGKIQKTVKELNHYPYGITPEISKLVLETIKLVLNLK